MPPEELEHIIKIAIECLRAQVVEGEEAKQLEEEVQKAMAAETVSAFLKL